MKTVLISIFLTLILFPSFVEAQEPIKYLTEKTGKIPIHNNLRKCPGEDVGLLTKSLSGITEWMRLNNPALNPPKGYDASITYFGNTCDKRFEKEEFGIASRIGFSFRYFYIENGVSQTATDWAARGTEFSINNPLAYIASRIEESGFNTDDPPHLKQPLEKALENLKRYHSINPLEKEIAPGVRSYAGGNVLIYNPDRPDIFIPVTVKEIIQAKLAYYKIKQEIDSLQYAKVLAAWAKADFKPEKSFQPMLYDAIKAEYDNFSSEELNERAYSSSNDGISMINARKEGVPIVRLNPDCWDKSLPKSALQFISIEYRTASPSELNSFPERNAGLAHYVGLFYNQLPIEKMVELIPKK